MDNLKRIPCVIEQAFPPPALPASGERNWGIDFLRILSMFMVVFLHASHFFGYFTSSKAASFTQLPQQLLYLLSYCAVNCFGMISGYVGFRSKYRLSRLFSFLLQVVFIYCACSILAPLLQGSAISWPGMVHRFILALSKGRSYWYVSAYILVLCFQPFLNLCINTMTRRQHRILLVTIVILFCLVPKDFFLAGSGYSGIWLIALYFIGAYAGLYGADFKWKRWHYTLALGISVTLLWVLCLVRASRWVYLHVFGYVGPLHVLNAFCLLLIFSKMTVRWQWVISFIRFFAPAAFGVYLIHMHPNIRPLLLSRAIGKWLHTLPGLAQLPIMLAICFGIYLFCSFAERLRLLLFAACNLLRKQAVPMIYPQA